MKLGCDLINGLRCTYISAKRYFQGNIDKAVKSGEFQRIIPESVTKNLILIGSMPGTPEEKQKRVQEYFDSLQQNQSSFRQNK